MHTPPDRKTVPCAAADAIGYLRSSRTIIELLKSVAKCLGNVATSILIHTPASPPAPSKGRRKPVELRILPVVLILNPDAPDALEELSLRAVLPRFWSDLLHEGPAPRHNIIGKRKPPITTRCQVAKQSLRKSSNRDPPPGRCSSSLTHVSAGVMPMLVTRRSNRSMTLRWA